MDFGAEIDKVSLVMTATLQDPGVRVTCQERCCIYIWYVPGFPDSVSVKRVDVRAYVTTAIIARSFRLTRQVLAVLFVSREFTEVDLKHGTVGLGDLC